MIKQARGKRDEFLYRFEYPASLSADLSVEESDREMMAFLRQKLTDRFPKETLDRVVKKRRVSTRRIGVPLEYAGVRSKPVRVGFLSFDHYSTQDRLGDLSQLKWGKKKYFTEVEIEIDPKFIEFIFLPEIYPVFKRFIDDFKATFNAEVTDLHKHQIKSHRQIINELNPVSTDGSR